MFLHAHPTQAIRYASNTLLKINPNNQNSVLIVHRKASIISATTWEVNCMDERQGTREQCTICGDTLTQEERAEALCEVCTDAWEREVDCHW
jgi:hypothetical protein